VQEGQTSNGCRRLSSVGVVCNAAHMQRNSAAPRGGPVVLRPVRATPCYNKHVPLFRCTLPATSPSSLCHRRLLPFPGGVACALKTRQFCPGRASSLSAGAPPVCSQRRGSYGVTTTSLRPCHRRPCNSTVAVSNTACGLQGGCHGVPRAAQSRAMISESVGSCR